MDFDLGLGLGLGLVRLGWVERVVGRRYGCKEFGWNVLESECRYIFG